MLCNQTCKFKVQHCKMMGHRSHVISNQAASLSWDSIISKGLYMRLNQCIHVIHGYTQPAQNVVLMLILGCDVEQPIFNVETMLLISTSQKQPIFNVRFQL